MMLPSLLGTLLMAEMLVSGTVLPEDIQLTVRCSTECIHIFVDGKQLYSEDEERNRQREFKFNISSNSSLFAVEARSRVKGNDPSISVETSDDFKGDQKHWKCAPTESSLELSTEWTSMSFDDSSWGRPTVVGSDVGKAGALQIRSSRGVYSNQRLRCRGKTGAGCQCIADEDGSSCASCSEGCELKGNGLGCKDVDECNSNNLAQHKCAEDCINTVGSYRCGCREHFTLKPDGLCEDDDECKAGTHICQSPLECRNTVGNYECVCPGGYERDGHLQKCLDIDECNDTNGGCAHRCINSPGNFSCSCDDGYFEDPANNKSCLDINECEVNKPNVSHNCTEGFQCHNIPGSFQCVCPEKDGFVELPSSHNGVSRCIAADKGDASKGGVGAEKIDVKLVIDACNTALLFMAVCLVAIAVGIVCRRQRTRSRREEFCPMTRFHHVYHRPVRPTPGEAETAPSPASSVRNLDSIISNEMTGSFESFDLVSTPHEANVGSYLEVRDTIFEGTASSRSTSVFYNNAAFSSEGVATTSPSGSAPAFLF